MAFLRWSRCVISFLLFIAAAVCAVNYKTSIYILRQASGQANILFNTETFEKYKGKNELSFSQLKNLEMIGEIRKYSVDSLGFKPTNSFTRIYDQQSKPLLWVITACGKYDLEPYEWKFPVVGKVSYKGFFKQDLAVKEYNHMIALGYDAELSPVSAWSTLGWFNDPVLSDMLNRSRGRLSNLIFHELFHSTLYLPGSVELNENLASFIADKATLRFLRQDTASLTAYYHSRIDDKIFSSYILKQVDNLKQFYLENRSNPALPVLKLRMMQQICDSMDALPLNNSARFAQKKTEILKYKNAWFIGYVQYDSQQDSLEKVFNKIYRGDLKKMVQELNLN